MLVMLTKLYAQDWKKIFCYDDRKLRQKLCTVENAKITVWQWHVRYNWMIQYCVFTSSWSVNSNLHCFFRNALCCKMSVEFDAFIESERRYVLLPHLMLTVYKNGYLITELKWQNVTGNSMCHSVCHSENKFENGTVILRIVKLKTVFENATLIFLLFN